FDGQRQRCDLAAGGAQGGFQDNVGDLPNAERTRQFAGDFFDQRHMRRRRGGDDLGSRRLEWEQEQNDQGDQTQPGDDVERQQQGNKGQKGEQQSAPEQQTGTQCS